MPVVLSVSEWVAIVVGLCASVIDVRTRRVPNVLTFGAVVVAVLLRSALEGLPGLASAAAGWLVGLLVILPLFLVRGLGGGDVKLVAAFGSLVGVTTVVWSALFGMIAGGVLGVALVLLHGVWRRTAANMALLLTTWRVNGPGAVAGLTLEDSQSLKLAYAVPLTIGLLVALWLGK